MGHNYFQHRQICFKICILTLALQFLFVYLFVPYLKYYINNSNESENDHSSESSVRLTNYKVDLLSWNNNKRQLKVDNVQSHDKWIVLTTINPPTDDVKKLAVIEGWKVVVVGDSKSPKDWSYPNCIHLDVEKQLSLGYEITKHLKFKSYARKSIGFLYAIQHGAKVIYETDDDNSPTSGKIGFDPDSSKSYLTYDVQDRYTVNPYVHFGQSTIWPRGYPLDKIADEPVHTYRRCSKQRSLVQQGVVNGDPDVDAIYRLTRKDAGVNLNVIFDETAEPVLLPRGLMAPYNSQNTLHLYDAFWGLLLPQTVAFRVCDIWRGYWTQRLLWEIDGYLSFFAPNAFTFRNAHDYLSDFIDEKQLYHDSSRFVQFLSKWNSSEEHFFDRILQLSIDMVKQDLWGIDDVTLVKAWLTDLIRIGYESPIVRQTISKCISDVQSVIPKKQPSSYLRNKGKLNLIET